MIQSKILELMQNSNVKAITFFEKEIQVVIKKTYNNWDSERLTINRFKKVERKAEKDEAFTKHDKKDNKIVVEKVLKNEFELYNEIVLAMEFYYENEDKEIEIQEKKQKLYDIEREKKEKDKKELSENLKEASKKRNWNKEIVKDIKALEIETK